MSLLSPIPTRRPADSHSLRIAIILPLSLAASIRLALLFTAYARTGTQVLTQGDTASYLQPARSLFWHGVYATAGQPELDRTPGYPIFAICSGMAWNNVLLTASIQIAIALLSTFLVYRITRQTFKDARAALWSAWLYALDPVSIVYSIRLMPETLFVFFLLLTVDRLLTYRQSAKLAAVASAGIALAAATYVRPVSYYLVLPLAIALVITSKRPSHRWLAPIVLLVTTVPLLAAWQFRNAIETGYTGFSSVVDKNLYFYQSAQITADLQAIPLGLQQQRLGYESESSYLALHPGQAAWVHAERLSYMHSQALQILAQHPVLAAKIQLQGMGLVAFTPGAAELLQLLALQVPGMPGRILNPGGLSSSVATLSRHPAQTGLMLLFGVWLLSLYALAVYAFAVRGASHVCASGFALALLLGVALYLLIVSGGAQAVGRYRVPIMPELVIFAAGGLTCIAQKKMRDPAKSPSFHRGL